MKQTLMILLIGLVACAPKQETKSTDTPSQPGSCAVTKPLKSLWASKTDGEVHDLRGLNFTFLYVPYSYVGSTGGTCNQDFRWFMFTPDINGASFKMEFQNIDSSAGCSQETSFYIKMNCTEMTLCNSNFSNCKTFQ